MEWPASIPHLFMFTFRTCMLTCLVAGLGIEFLGMISMVRFYFRKAPPLPALKKLPGISIIKPCYGINENEQENFQNFFLQNYQGPIQILFVVSDEKDPVVPTIKEYLRRFPEADAQLVI